MNKDEKRELMYKLIRLNNLSKTFEDALNFAFEEGTEYDYLLSGIEIINKEFGEFMKRANELLGDYEF